VRKSRPLVISLSRYRDVLAQPDLRDTIAISILGRLPIGIAGLAILLTVQSAFASFAAGGVASAAYVFGLALVAPALGRAIDRIGPRIPLYICAVGFPAALAGLAAAVYSRAPAVWLYVLPMAAGALFPPITVCLRTLLRRRLAEDRLLAAAYSLESVLIEIIFIAGPLIVALFVALLSPVVAVLFAAACGAVGTVLFLQTAAMRTWRVEPQSARRLLGPMRSGGFVALIAVILGYSMAFGLLEIGLTAYATQHGSPAMAGVLLGITSVGSALGGLAYGSRGWHFPLVRQFAATLLLMSLGMAALAFPLGPLPFSVICALAGVVMAPALIIQSMLVAKTAPPEHSTEAFTWSTSALLSGVGLGLAAGGALLEIAGAHVVLGAGAMAAVAAAAAARLLLRPES
jgi:MFS family permease